VSLPRDLRSYLAAQSSRADDVGALARLLAPELERMGIERFRVRFEAPVLRTLVCRTD
jgi:hypothetical protein